ncbi:hypothetical protein P9112_005570 [Eukaryota sp. TZLM1-RC]
MRLRVHNIVQCCKPRCPSAYPLSLSVISHEVTEHPFDRDLLKNLMQKIDYPVLLSSASFLDVSLPESLPPSFLEDEDLCRQLHRILNEVDIVEGTLTCSGCQRVYPIKETVCSFVNFVEPATIDQSVEEESTMEH